MAATPLQLKELNAKQTAEDMNRSLAKAAQEGDAELVRYYVAKGCDPRTELKEGFKPPLYWACRYGHIELAKELIEKYQCSPKYVTERGTTLLYLACTMGHATLARYLAKTHLLDPNVRVKDVSMLHAACSNGHLPVARFLVGELCCDPRADDNLLHTVCARGHLEIAKYFIEELHFDPSHSGAFGQTPLLAASSNGHLAVARYLIEARGCSVACTDDAGYTPLHLACQHKHLEVVSYLLQREECDPSRRDMTGSTPVHLACRYGGLEVVKMLLQTGRVDPSATNHAGEAPIQIAHNKDIIRELIRGGARTKGVGLTAEQLLLQSGDSKCRESLVRMFVVGHPSTGKSTLVKALQMGGKKHAPGFARRAKVTGVPTRTAGIIPTEFDSPEFGRVLMFDFAGQYEYYASHATLLECTGDCMPPLFVVVVDLSKGDEEVHHLIHYWTTFLESHRSSTASKPHLIVIGSHKDIVKKKDSSYKSKISVTEQFVRREIEHSSFHLAGFFAIDCREPTKHQKLRHCMRESCHSLRDNVEVDTTCQVLSIFLLDEFRDQMTCQVKDVINLARKSDLAIPLTTERLCELCEALSNRMSILFLKNSPDLGKSWIVLDIETLLSKINGRIFAPKGFTERCFEASNTGILSYSDIWKTFQDLDPSLVVAFLNRLEFCQPVSDPEVLRLIRDGSTPTIYCSASSSSSDSEENDGPSILSPHSHKCLSAPNLLDMDGGLSQYVERDNPDPPGTNSLVAPPKPRLIYHQSGITPTHEQPNLSFSCSTLPVEAPNSFLFFPALIGVDSPSNSVWQLSDDSQFTYHTGWCLQCSQNNFFTPRLLQILLLRMAFGFAVGKTAKNGFMPDPYVFQRECTLWKNGVRWVNLDGIEAVVEMIDKGRTILLLMRGMKGSRMKFIQLRAQVIHKILEAKEEFCSNVVTQESLIDVSCLKQPYERVKRELCNQQVRLYDIVLVARSIVEKRRFVYDRVGQHLRQLDELLDFEPYANLGEELLGELFDEEEKIDDELLEFLYRFSQCNYDRASLFAEVLGISLSRRITPNHSPRSSFSMSSPPNNTGMINGTALSPMSSFGHPFMGQNPCMDVLNHWWEKGSVSLVDFRRQMDDYSLFSGRNILGVLYHGVTNSSVAITL